MEPRRKRSSRYLQLHKNTTSNRKSSRTKSREGNAMRYTGGKAAISQDIHDIIEQYESIIFGEIRPYIEPFAGAMSVAFKFALDNKNNNINRKITICDANKDMTTLWSHLKKSKGRDIPDYVSEKQYNEYKTGSRSSPLKGYIGSVYSFGGAMYGAYRGRYQSLTKTKQEGKASKNKMMKIIPLLKFIQIIPAKSYDACYTHLKPRDSIIYCDPPYDTQSEKSNPNKFLRDFNHDKFWNQMRLWSKNNLVFISELEENIPEDFAIIWTKTIKRSFRSRSNNKDKNEALCIHMDWYNMS